MRLGTGKPLFRNVSVLEVLPNQEQKIKAKIQSLSPDYLLNASEDDLVDSLVDEYTLNVPAIDEANIHLDYGEEKIDVSGAPMRMFYGDGPFYVSATRFTFVIPVTGDINLLTVQPQGCTFRLSSNKAEIAGDAVQFSYVGENVNPEQAKQEFQGELNEIKQNLANLKTALDQHNEGLAQSIRGQIQQRKNKLLADANIAAAIGFPIKKRDGAPTTYSVPIQKRRPTIERPPPPQGPFQPEPLLAMAEYEAILSIVRNMVQVMEQSPKAFEQMGEEDLRTHFLVQLNGQYEGRATGETFNFQGKTDILIREEGKNVFIAECKFWKGEQQYLDTITQILSYLSWRDTKAAIFIFNRNISFSNVLSKIEEITPTYPNYKRSLEKFDESSFRYVFHHNQDRNRELIITVMAFDIPTARKAN